MTKEYKPFDFIKAASNEKIDLIRQSDEPKQAEKQYVPYVVNRGFSYFSDTILHANEMNRCHGLFPGAQFDYYMGSLRKRKRFSKWHKAEKNKDLDMIQEVYKCNRTVAKQYLKVLTPEDMKQINTLVNKGGS